MPNLEPGDRVFGLLSLSEDPELCKQMMPVSSVSRCTGYSNYFTVKLRAPIDMISICNLSYRFCRSSKKEEQRHEMTVYIHKIQLMHCSHSMIISQEALKCKSIAVQMYPN